MAIFLTILKIIGIVLLCLIGFIILVLSYFIFLPFWYQASGEIDKEKNYKINIKATTFLHFAQFHMNYEKDDEMKLKATIFGVLLKVFPRENNNTSNDDLELIDSVDDIDDIESNTILNDEVSNDIMSINDKDVICDNEKDNNEINFDIEKSSGNEDETNSFFKKISPKYWIEALKKKVSDLKIKFTDIKSKIKDIITEIKREENKEFFKKVISLLKKFIKSLKLNLNGTNLMFSLGAPDLTGLVLGGLALFPCFVDKHVSIKPDFETEELYFEGKVFLKGRICIISMIKFALAVYFDPNGKKIIKKVLGGK